MSTEENKAIERRVIEEGFNKGNLSVIDELVSKDHVNHSDKYAGPEQYKNFIMMYRAAFPDLLMTIEDQIAEGDEVVQRWTATGTHRGELMGIPPTGKKIEITGTYTTRIVEGKIVEDWGNWDTLSMMQQLGVIPPMEGGE